MLVPFTGPEALDSAAFLQQGEATHNVMRNIASAPCVTALQNAEGTFIALQNEGLNAWIWAGSACADWPVLTDELADRLQGVALPGITAEPEMVSRFIERYCPANGCRAQRNMPLVAYELPGEPIAPAGVPGERRKAVGTDADLVARWFVAFDQECFGIQQTPEGMREAAEKTIAEGGLWLWVVDDEPVSLARAARRSTRHHRIGPVYTPPEARGKHYSQALVAEVCGLIRQEGLMPLLYADGNNPISNRVYQNIGFLQRGTLEEIKFIREGSH